MGTGFSFTEPLEVQDQGFRGFRGFGFRCLGLRGLGFRGFQGRWV